jgi:hypothetical protein
MLSRSTTVALVSQSITQQLIQGKVDPSIILPPNRFLVFIGTDG